MDDDLGYIPILRNHHIGGFLKWIPQCHVFSEKWSNLVGGPISGTVMSSSCDRAWRRVIRAEAPWQRRNGFSLSTSWSIRHIVRS